MEPNERSHAFRVVLTDNPLVSPFPSHRWLTKEDAERFSNDPNGAREFTGKLTVVEESDAGPKPMVKP